RRDPGTDRLRSAMGLRAFLRAAAVLLACATLSGCVDLNRGGIQLGSGIVGGANDINAQPADTVRDGGNLRLATSAIPSNWNILSSDGNDEETAWMMWWLMPRAFNSDAGGRLTVNHDFFTDVRLTGANPQTVVYTINPRAVWSDGSPITWEDIASQAH